MQTLDETPIIEITMRVEAYFVTSDNGELPVVKKYKCKKTKYPSDEPGERVLGGVDKSLSGSS